MHPITVGEILLRVSLAFLAGFAVGWEREARGRPAGLRTNILACVAAAVAMIVAECLLERAAVLGSDSVRADPARLGAGILAGIGFLGGGTILRHENFIRGVTTAATLWTVTILGLAFGAGLFALGGIGVAFALVTLALLSALEKRLKSDWYAMLKLTAGLGAVSEEEVRKKLESLGATVQAIKLTYLLEKKQQTIFCDLKIKRPERFEFSAKALDFLCRLPGVQEVSWE